MEKIDKIPKSKINRRFRLFRWRISVILLIVFSSVLFINNVTQLFERYGWSYNINIITWIGIIGSLIYAIWEITGEKVR